MILISRADRVKIFFKSLLIQGSWNYHAMIGVGFCFSILPMVKYFSHDKDAYEDFLQRHLSFFNSHPYMATWCLGAVAKLEEEAHNKEWNDYRPISVFKERLIGPLGLIGDSLFWNALKPAVAAIAFFMALLAGWIAIPIFLILYNIPHFYVRIVGLDKSYKKGFDIISDLSIRHFESSIQNITKIGLLATGLSIMIVLRDSIDQGSQAVIAFTSGFILTIILNFKSTLPNTQKLLIVISISLTILLSTIA